MPLEFNMIILLALLAICLLGFLQQRLARNSDIHFQIQRNFNETFWLVLAGLLILSLIDGHGEWSANGAIFYAVGRWLYFLLSVTKQMPIRKYSWALSMVGFVGVFAQLAKTLILLV